ncbi:acyl-ACP desaturase [Marinobacter nanhaiticus D15-8W]|uniref:Acyl-ACP desaturase n=1 Tax=Marinobacter nanhaiticus D15-8W TaxID=626887 RepID=N6WXX7_9GAMM|nr:acyl-ACP desaturase [Marinobacter nanhaiticus]ENO16456.2 acyl-ACP desaturase [Marinobacter nanhaiticus D15-8W]BES72243.1 acyl-ACP desaturase [Marinobacter nanhaiticus D15-8W]
MNVAMVPSKKTEALASLEPLVEELMDRHLKERKLWMPSEFVPASEQMTGEELKGLDELRDRARGLPDSVRVSLALNLLTEEGLPHFHRLIAVHLGSENAWSRWNFLWTAEEDRHGCALHDYVRDARLFDMKAFEYLQYQYIEAGFDPQWHGDPYQLLAYTSLQERATQAAHANTGKLAAKYDPTIQRLLGHIAADESRHFRFYRDAFRGLLEIDSTGAMESALKVMPRLAMPGHNIAGYDDMADVVHRSGIYGPRDYRKVVQECLDNWGIADLKPVDAAGREAQDKMMAVPARLDKLAGLLERRMRSKSFSFDIIYQRVMEFDA